MRVEDVEVAAALREGADGSEGRQGQLLLQNIREEGGDMGIGERHQGGANDSEGEPEDGGEAIPRQSLRHSSHLTISPET